MEKFVPYEKLSAKERRQADRQRRASWIMSPVTRVKESGKIYNRKRLRVGAGKERMNQDG